MLTLFKSKKFQEDYARYQRIISDMPAGNAQTEAIKLLTQLVNAIKIVDENISEISMSNQMPSNMPDLRNNIQVIRKQLDAKVRDWGEAKPK